MILIGPYQTCPFSTKCPVSSNCYGTFKDRPNQFECDFVDNQGNFNEKALREGRTLFNMSGRGAILLEEVQ